jgi:endonuclease/exonuclease/phosphatase family metal-dependent hydrolase
MRLRAPVVVAVLVALALTSASLDTAASAAPGKRIPRGLQLTASTPTSVTVAWQPVPKATSYRLVLAKKRGTGKPRRVDVASPTATVGELRPGTRYVVSVRALLGAKAKPGQPSRPLRVTTGVGAPAGGLRVTASGPMAISVDWDDTPGAASYRVRMAAVPDMSGAVEMTFAQSAASLRGVPPNHTYYAQAMAVDAAGQPIGGWSAVVPVATPPPPPQPKKPALTVASFNVRCANCYQRQNGEKPWSTRRAAVIAQIVSRRPDVIGVQEASQGLLKGTGKSQFGDLRDGLHAAGAGYELTNTARYNCANPNSPTKCSPQYRGASQGTRVFYNPATVDLVNAGSKLLPSCAGCNNRYMAWAIFKQKSTDQRFFFATVHTQYLAKYAGLRQQEIHAMMDEVAAQNPGLPAFVTGDFNSTRYQSPTNAPYDEVIHRGFVDPLGHTPKSPMVSETSTAEQRIRANYNSHNNFLRRVAKFAEWQNGSNLDYIFTYSPTGPMRVTLWETVLDLDASDRIVGTIPSDHNMVLIKAVLP